MRRTGWLITSVALVALAAACSAPAADPVAGSATRDSAPAASSTATSGPLTDAPRDSVPSSTPTTQGNDPDGIGDELFPPLGNPGLDVQHYDVDLTVDQVQPRVSGQVGIDVRLTEDRSEITLDAAGPTIDALQVDGADALFRQDGAELRIELAGPRHAGDDLRIDVAYHFDGTSTSDASGLATGWFDTPGGSYVLNEPDGARTWLPSNDHPSDKATFDFTIHTSPGVTGVANGALDEHTSTTDGETWRWSEDQPMATYLIQLLTGDYELIDGTGPDGLPLTSAVLRSELARVQPAIDRMPEQIAVLEQFFGPYPLDRYGIAVTDSASGLAMETQGRSLFSKDDPQHDVVEVHELAHQWFGDAVTPARWQDVWLNESFATYAEWLWGEHQNGPTTGQMAEQALRQRPPGVTADPTVADLFGFDVYQGGATALEALRRTVGDDAFFEILQEWVRRNDGRSRTTEDFVALAEEISGMDLTAFFDAWIYAEVQPTSLPPLAAPSTTTVPATVPVTTGS